MTKDKHLPSISETAFDCPHCGAFTTQFWFNIHAIELDKEQKTPRIPKNSVKERLLENNTINPDKKSKLIDWLNNMASGLVFLVYNRDATYGHYETHNLYLSKCYNCGKIAVWVHDNLLFPPEKEGPKPNTDLPEDVIHDFEEARSILNLSPRGAAALLRLSIQKLCIFLGEKGKNIDDDIASLVSKGLNSLVQKSLDIVRVLGNEAVHPGVIDLKDDRDTALRLFDLVNIIADQMITRPKNINSLYEKLPGQKKKAIEDRNGRTKSKK